MKLKITPMFLALALAPVFAFAQQAVLYVGSDWCDAGTQIEKAFTAPKFTAAAKTAGVETIVYDLLENETDESRAKLKELGKYAIPLDNYPAFAYFDAKGRCVYRRDGLPYNTSGKSLLKLINYGKKQAEKLENLLAKNSVDSAVEAIKMTLDGFGVPASKNNANGMKDAWNQLFALDKADSSGWQFALEFNPYNQVYKVQEFAKNKKFAEGEKFIRELEAKSRHLSNNQKQGLHLFYYVLYRGVPEKKDYCKRILLETLAIEAGTFYGNAAQGLLAEMGAADKLSHKLPPEIDFELRERKAVKLEKPYKIPNYKTVVQKYPTVLKYAKAQFSRATLDKISTREGGVEFLNKFFADATWMENFFGSGPAKGNWNAALEALDTLCANVPVKTVGDRKWATALALNMPDCQPLAAVRLFKATQWARSRKLFAKGADAMPVAMMRYVMSPGQISGEDMMFLAKKYNIRPREYGGACWKVAYRLNNFFGDSVQGPRYFAPWAGAYGAREQALYIGSVCGGLSYYGSACAKAHGVPSVPGGQPGHCAYSLWRAPEDRWWICYNVGKYTGTHFNLYGHSFQFLDMQSDAFYAPVAERKDSLRKLWAAQLAQKETMTAITRSDTMTCSVYDWKGNKLPPNVPAEWQKITPKRTETVENLNCKQDGQRNNVMLVWKGNYTASAECEASIELASDDGSRLIINGNVVIDHDGPHGMTPAKTAKVKLKKGKNPFELQYMNIGGGMGLSLKVEPPKSLFVPAIAEKYDAAVAASPANYDAWLAYDNYLASTIGVPAKNWEQFATNCATALKNHVQVAWDLLERHAVPEIRKAKTPEQFVAFMCQLHKIIKQGTRPTAEFCDFASILNRHMNMIDAKNVALQKKLLTAILEGQYGTPQAFPTVVQWGGKRFLSNPETTQIYVDAMKRLLLARGDESGADLGKYVTNAILEASNADNFEAFKSLAPLVKTLSKPRERADKNTSFTKLPLLSDQGMLRISSNSQWNRPDAYLDIVDGKVNDVMFHTGKEKGAWASIRLPGEANVGAVLIENPHTQNDSRCVPFVIEVSEDGKSWTQVGQKIEKVQGEYQLTFPQTKACYVRVRCVADRQDFLHFRKFMVFGTKLY